MAAAAKKNPLTVHFDFKGVNPPEFDAFRTVVPSDAPAPQNVTPPLHE